MKRLILTVVMGLLCLGSEEVQGQNAPHLTFIQGPNISRSIRGRELNYNDWNPITEPGPQPDGSYLVGDFENGSDRYIDVLGLQWNLPASLRSGAHIDSVRLTIDYRNYDGDSLRVRFLHTDYEVWFPPREDVFLDAVLLREPEIDRVRGAPWLIINDELVGSSGRYFYGSKDYPYEDSPPRDAVQMAVDNGQEYFTILIRGEAFYWEKLWHIKPEDVRLEVYYSPPESELIGPVTITNVVDGTRDWALVPESRVRGDLNVYDHSGWADYAQLPPFEPPHATRTWDTWYYHLTETWFAKFEHPSFSGRRKFRYWNESDQAYRVAQYTDLWEGDVDDYRAVTDTAWQTRNLVKREITSAYNGLSFDFRDPWRVAQNTNAGGPDSAQYVLDGFTAQLSPYLPWDDSLSWGVFKNVDRSEPPYYATRYWRYYDYDAGSDSYTRKDGLPLGEGDLIHMDEISQGRGMEVSPAGSIEYTDATVAGTAYRDYSIEYKDATQGMDLTGVFKAHLLSNKEGQPTRSANQRKLDIGPDSVYHMVYESAGEVWYTQSADGAVWSPEELVSDYTHTAGNASLAVLDSSVYVTYMQDGVVMLRRRYKDVWYTYPLLDGEYSNNGANTTPVVAASKTCYADQGDIVVLVWDAQEYLKYNMLYLYYSSVYVDTINGLYQIQGSVALNAAEYPVCPAITSHDDLKFTVAWREGKTLQAAEIDIGGGSCDKRKFVTAYFVISLPEVTLPYDSCIYAPSITTDHQGKPVVAYEVKRPSIIYSDRWVNVRTYDYSSGSWNTTVYQLPFYSFTNYGDPIAPSIGAHTTTSTCGGGDLARGLRVAYHQDWGGGIRVGKFDCSYSATDQLTGGESFPSVVPFAPNGKLREAYSAPFQTGPFMHALRTTNAALTKTTVPDMRLLRDLRVGVGNAVAMLGITDLSVLHGNSVRDEIAWQALPDTLVIGDDGTAREILRTETFTISSGDRFEYKTMLYCTDPGAMPTGASISVQLRRAADDAVLREFGLALGSFPADTASWNDWSRNLSMLANETVYISLGIAGTLPANAEVNTAKVWIEEQFIPKASAGMDREFTHPTTMRIGQNHPNPFTGQTRIPFYLPSSASITLSVHDITGREVATITQGAYASGHHESTFDANDLPAGTYILKLTAGSETVTRNMVHTK
jgi:hypothetical protein